MRSQYPVTPDGRYFVVKGRLWRCTDPSIPANAKQRLVGELMQARRAKGEALRNADALGREAARQRVDEPNINWANGDLSGGTTVRLTGIVTWWSIPPTPIGLSFYPFSRPSFRVAAL